MHGGRTHIDKGNGDPVVLESGEEKDAEGHLVCLGENSVIGVFFIDFDLINDKPSDPVKVDGADFHFAFEGLFDAFNGDFFDQLGEYTRLR